MIKLEKEPVNMAEVREGIDRLDRALVDLLSERQRYIEAAGRIKPRRDQVRDEWRINDVLTKVTAHASVQGLNPGIATKIWRSMMEAFIAYEFEVYDGKEKNGAP
jgi:isochorismate pyruvate lyase